MCVRNNCFRFPSHATPTHTHTHTNTVAPKMCCLTPIGATPHFKNTSMFGVGTSGDRRSPIARGAITSMCWQHLCATIGLGFVVAERQDWVFVWETRLVSSNADVQLLLSVSCLPGDTKDDVGETRFVMCSTDVLLLLLMGVVRVESCLRQPHRDENELMPRIWGDGSEAIKMDLPHTGNLLVAAHKLATS